MNNKLICPIETYYLIISDAILGFGHIIIIRDVENFDTGSYFDLCQFQAWIIHFGILSSFMWANLQALKLYSIIQAVYQTNETDPKDENIAQIYHKVPADRKLILAYGIPAVITTL